MFRENPADLIITDIIMPEKEGIETIRTIKREFPSAKIIAISGGGRQGDGDYLETAEILGADCSLRKPFGQREILDAIHGLLE